MSAAETARAGIARFRDGDNTGWHLLWEASQQWRAEGDSERADIAEAEARRTRWATTTPGGAGAALDLDGAALRLRL